MNYWCEYESIRGITLRAIERAISILSSPPSKDSTYDGLSTNFASIIAEIVCTAQNFPDEIESACMHVFCAAPTHRPDAQHNAHCRCTLDNMDPLTTDRQ